MHNSPLHGANDRSSEAAPLILSPFEWTIAKRYMLPGRGEAVIALVVPELHPAGAELLAGVEIERRDGVGLLEEGDVALDLVEHLIQWGSGVALFVLIGARPELRDLRSSLVTPGGLVSDVVTLSGLDAGAAGCASGRGTSSRRDARPALAGRFPALQCLQVVQLPHGHGQSRVIHRRRGLQLGQARQAQAQARAVNL